MAVRRCGARSGLPYKKGPNHPIRKSTIPRRHQFCPPSLRPTRTVVRGHIDDALERRTMPRMQRMGVVGAKKCRLRIFWAWRQRRAALDRHLPLRGHGNTQKNSKQQSTCGWRRVRAAGGMGRVMEVTPYARIRNLVGWRRRAAINCHLPLFWVPKAPKQIKQQSTSRRRRGRGAGDCRGARK